MASFMATGPLIIRYPDGCCCGVNNELDILRETGCYADFTLPSAPDPTQTRTINSIYYAVDDPIKPKSHDRGIPVGTGTVPSNGLMLIQGPLVLDWGRRKWGLVPRIENGCIQSNQPAGIDRLHAWLNGRRAGSRASGLVLRETAHSRCAGVEPEGPPGRANGPLPSRPGQPCSRMMRTSSFIM